MTGRNWLGLTAAFGMGASAMLGGLSYPLYVLHMPMALAFSAT